MLVIGRKAAPPPVEGVVTWSEVRSLLKFDQNLTDSKGIQAAATAVGTSTYSTSEKKFGTAAFDFAGNNGAQLSNNIIGRLGGVKTTFEGWIRPTSVSNNDNGHNIFSNYTLSAVNGRFVVSIVPGASGQYKLKFIATVNTVNTGGDARRTSTLSAPLNQWSHFAVGIDATTTPDGQGRVVPKVYFSLNGVTELISSGFDSGSQELDMVNHFVGSPSLVEDGQSQVVIGFPIHGYMGGFAGQMDELRVTRNIVYPANYSVPATEFPTS